MLALAINLLWLLVVIVALAGVVWLVLYGVNQFVYQLPARVEQGIWFIFLLLVLIALLSMLAGGSFKFPNLR